MKYLSKHLLKICIVTLCFTYFTAYGLDNFIDDRSIYTTDPVKAIDTQDIKDPLREGSLKIIDSDPNSDNDPDQVKNIINIGFITKYTQVKSSTLNVIKNIINYALGLLSLIALLYLIYHGFLMVTSNDDEGRYKQGMSGMKYAVIALVGIGVSWFVITFVIYLVDTVTGTGS